MSGALVLPDAAAASDLDTFVARATLIQAAAVVRLLASGSVLAVYAGALHGGGGPTVLALRVVALAEPAQLDETVSASGLARALVVADPSASAGVVRLTLPPTSVAAAGWVGLLPPRAGWALVGQLAASQLRDAARAGMAQVASGAPEGSGAAAVTRLRAMVWGRPLAGQVDLPAGAAFAAEAFGFLAGPGERQSVDGAAPITVHRCARWWRLSSPRGHVLARAASGLG